MNIKKTTQLLLFSLFTLLFSSLSIAVTVTGSGSTFTINKLSGFDGADGVNREAVFIAAARYWADILVSPVPIVIDAEFSSLSCNAELATLGSAGPLTTYLSRGANRIGLQNNVWYPTALFNAHSGSDKFPGSADISALFNANLGNSDCLANSGWYYGMDGKAPRDKIDFYDVVLHELGHGLGILSLVNSDGSDQTRVDIFTTFLYDQSTHKEWAAMTNNERNSSVNNTGNVVWSGTEVNARAKNLTAGVNSGKVQMYAPNPYETGSSISHFDTALSPNELMEPEYNGNTTAEHSIALLKDIGWSIFTSVNNVPDIIGQSNLSTNEDTSLTFTLNDLTVSDIDNNYPEDFSLTVSNGNNYTVSGYTITPASNYSGSLAVPIRVNDGTDNSASYNLIININGINDAPIITGLPTTTVAEDTSYSFIPTISDVDVGDSKKFSIINKPSWATFSTSTGMLTGTPTNADVGVTANIIITVTDSVGASDSLDAFSITVSNVNDAPVITGSPVTTIAEDTLYIFIPMVSDIDISDTQRFTIANKPSWASFSTTSGVLTGTPSNADVGTTVDIIITVVDKASATDSLTRFSITVLNINDAPIISGSPATNVAVNTHYSFTPLVSDEDVGDTKTFSITNKPSWATFSTTSGLLAGTPTNANLGISSNVTITVTDTSGATDSLPAFMLTVSNINHAPVITGSPATTVTESSRYHFIPTVTDIDASDTKSFSITNKPNWATFSTSTGILTGTPTNTEVGVTSGIVITVTDSKNESASLPAFTITVTVINQAPIADDQVYVFEEDNPLTITLTANDASEDLLTYAIIMEPVHGVLVQSTSNTYIYTPEDNYHGADSFTYQATDGSLDSQPATVDLTISPVNDAPVAEDDVIVLIYSEEGSYTLDVLNNDSDVDGDELTLIDANSSLGKISLVSGQLVYQLSGFLNGDIELHYAISDGHTSSDNGTSEATVTIRFDTNVNTLLPIITLPNDIDINATSLFTKVNLGVATAIDSTGAQLPVSLVDNITRFSPGNNSVYWQTQDSNGFSRTATQHVAVQPIINLARDRQGSEGLHYKIAVYLNGESPNYPVTIPYSVAGNADSDDHNLDSGELIINSGLVGYIEFDAFDDTHVETDETIIITLNDALNLGPKSEFTLTLTEDNITPQASVTISQNNEQRTLIDKSLGNVVITSAVFDANNNDSHRYTWTSTSGELIDIDTENTSFTFDPTSLLVGQQILSLVVTDDGNSPLSTEVFAYLNIVESLPTLTNIDTDGDLIPDNIEGYSDTDADGIADYLDDNNTHCNIQPEKVSEHGVYIIETESSVCLQRGVNTASNEFGSILLRVDEISQDNEATNIGGLFDFILSGLPIAGQSVSLVLPQRLPIPENAIYRKLIPNTGWVNFTVDSNNNYASAAGEIGYCPAPNDGSWTNGLTAGHWCVQITIEDGGVNDNDRFANNQIVDPGGVAIWVNTNTLPNIQNEEVTTTQNKLLTIDVLANDTDSDGDSLTIISADVDFGRVLIVEQKLNYQPDTNFFGLANINYGVSDGNNGTGFATVTVNVIANTAPVTVNDSVNTDDNTVITIDVLANDTDIDNDVLTLTNASAEQGNIDISNNMLVYTPLSGFNGIDTLIYTIDDNNGGTNQGEVTVTITATITTNAPSGSSGGSLQAFILCLSFIILFSRRKNT